MINWHTSRGLRHNQPYQVWLRSVQGVQSYGGSNFTLLNRNGLSPTTVLHVICRNSQLAKQLSAKRISDWVHEQILKYVLGHFASLPLIYTEVKLQSLDIRP